MNKQPTPKVKPQSPLHNASRVPLGQMLNDLDRASGMNQAQKMNQLVSMAMGPRKDITSNR